LSIYLFIYLFLFNISPTHPYRRYNNDIFVITEQGDSGDAGRSNGSGEKILVEKQEEADKPCLFCRHFDEALLHVRSNLPDFNPPKTFSIKCAVCIDSDAVAGIQIGKFGFHMFHLLDTMSFFLIAFLVHY
jgi:hypothetical protein